MKKEISDHIAKAFLETREPRSQRQDNSFVFYIVLSVCIVALLVLGISFFTGSGAKGLFSKNTILRLESHDGPYSLKFDFNYTKSQASSLNIDLPDIDLKGFSSLGFKIRFKETDSPVAGNLKLSLVNKRKETSSLYFSQLNHSWKSIAVPLSSFGNIKDWSRLIGISFTVEPWNVNAKKGELLIDDIQFQKN